MSSDSSGKKPLGKILLEQKVVTPEKLENLLKSQKASGERLGTIADRELPEKHVGILKALSIQHGVPAINLDEVVIPLKLLEMVPLEIARKHRVLPIFQKEDHLFLVMADPQNHNVVDEIEFVTGKKVFRYVTIEGELKKIIDQCYSLYDEGVKFFRGKNVNDEKYRKIVSSLGGEPEIQKESAPKGAGTSGKIQSTLTGAEAFQQEAIEKPFAPPPTEDLLLEDADFVEPLDEIPIDVESETPKLKVLVVDDEEDILNLISKVLRENGYMVLTATNGREALTIIKREMVDLIILDAMLPEIHGFDICKKIKGSQKYGNIPVIMISAIYRGWRFARDLKESYGVDEFIEKPFKIKDLLRSVETMLKRKSTFGMSSIEEMSYEAQKQLEESAKAYQKGDFNKAIEHLKAAIKIDPLSQKLHYNLALVYGKAGMIYYAISELETVLELDPTMFQAMKNLAVLYQEAGFKNKSIEMWERAMSVCEDEEAKKKIKEHLLTLL